MKDKFNKKYIIITKDLQKNLIEFLDEIQFDIAGDDDKESMHKVNFISWAINELLSGYEAFFPKDSKKKRDDYVDETFLDWNLPDMSDEEYEKLITEPYASIKPRSRHEYKGTHAYIDMYVKQLKNKLSKYNRTQADVIIASCEGEINRLCEQLQKAEGIRGQEGFSKNQQAQAVLESVCSKFEEKKNELLSIKEKVVKNQNFADYGLIQKFDNYSRQIIGASDELKRFCEDKQVTLKTNVTYGRKVWEWLRAFITFGMVKARRYKADRLLSQSVRLFSEPNNMRKNGGNTITCGA